MNDTIHSAAASHAATLPEIVDRIVRQFDPLQIILFGSHARRHADHLSDLDLVVVLPNVADRHRATVAILRALSDLAPVDVVVTDPAEIERRGALIGNVLRSALREGLVLYERE
ncbi:hypothetical protein BH23CHL2_BH23CHL2_09960 [soil metagenome]